MKTLATSLYEDGRLVVTHEPLPLAGSLAKSETAFECGCGIDIMEFTPIYWGCW